MVTTNPAGYGEQVGVTSEGHPVFVYTNPQSQLTSYVVVLPDGRAFYADKNGRITSRPVEANKQVGLALIGGLIGFALGGPGGAVAGAAIGAVLGNLPTKRVE